MSAMERYAIDIRELVRNGDDRELQEVYSAINDLIEHAGNVTIRDLFLATADELGSPAIAAIRAGKKAGIFRFNNRSCCSGDQCVPADDGYCSLRPDGQISALSDVCPDC